MELGWFQTASNLCFYLWNYFVEFGFFGTQTKMGKNKCFDGSLSLSEPVVSNVVRFRGSVSISFFIIFTIFVRKLFSTFFFLFTNTEL